MHKFIILTESRNFSDEKFYVNINYISEVIPRSMAERRGDSDDWNSMVVMTDGNLYKVLEQPNRVLELIIAAQ
jgi:hypothetical protein